MSVAAITGPSRGIGSVLADSLKHAGWDVEGIGRSASGWVSSEAVADVRDVAGVSRAVGAIEARHGGIDLLVANAGVLSATGQTWEVDPDDWWQELEVNIRGTFNVVRAALPLMVEQGRGRIILMSSGMGGYPTPWMSAYGASKAAVTHLAGSLAKELEGTGVSVFAISPGVVLTDMTDWPAEVRRRRPDLDAMTAADFLPATMVCDLVADLASGRFDALSGRFIHVRDDREALLAQQAQA